MTRNLLIALLLFVFVGEGLAQNEFITTWQTTTSNENITIPTTGTGYNYSVDWGDGSSETGLTGNATHTYTSAGTYAVKISGDFPRIFFNNSGDKDKIRTIEQWGNIQWTSMNSAFFGCGSLTYNATDTPDLSNVTSLANMFSYCYSFNGDINNWDVSNVKDISGLFLWAKKFNQSLTSWDVSNVINTSFLFAYATAFNQPLGTWNVSKVTDMTAMFSNAISYNQDISNWDVSRVTRMGSMFMEALKFNQPLNSWDVSSVTEMYFMFNKAEAFNQPLNNWDVSSVQNMTAMFNRAKAFNQPLNNWEVSAVKIMNSMFSRASSFDQDISSWNVGGVTDMSYMFYGASLFNQDINSWNVSNVLNMSFMFEDAISFNQALSAWDVGSVTRMDYMFSNAKSFNQDISSWNVSNVTKMSFMFADAIAFNQFIGSWNVANVTNMLGMFSGAKIFNQNISDWNVGKVTVMSDMFKGASSFNQDLGAWNIINVRFMNDMLDGTAMSINNFDNTLIGWSAQVVQSGVTLGASGLVYCNAQSARNTLINDYNWVINDWGNICSDIAFTTTWQTADNQITIPTYGSGYNYNIYWTNLTTPGVGDGLASGQTGNYTITGLTNGDVYQVKIVGDFPRIHFSNSGDKDKILTIEQWGNIQWSSMLNAFYGCKNLTYNATDAPDLTNVTTLNWMFADTESFNGNLNNWDVSGVTNMSSMFSGAVAFNQPLDSWNVGQVQNMTAMFRSAESFNQDLSNWNVTNVTSMNQMFSEAKSFNQSLNTWDVSNVTNMYRMFAGAKVFNQPIDNWNVSNVTDMFAMFSGAKAFNQPLATWNVSNVSNMKFMFSWASSFNQNLGTWDVSNIGQLDGFLNYTALSKDNYDNTLIGWSSQTLQSGVTLGASGLLYCNAESARNTLVTTYGWTITDNGKNCNDAPTDIALTSLSINENNSIADVVGSFSTTDPNGSDTHTYLLVNGSGDSDNDSFTILGNELQAAEVFNFEKKPSYSIRVRTDDGNGGTFDATFSVTINDVNDAPTSITLSSNTMLENNAIGNVVGSLSTTDADGSDTHTYSLVSGTGDTDNASFTITGAELQTGEVFDFETKSTYSIRVETNDGNGGTYQESFTISVTDINEAPTAIALSANTIAENNAVGDVIGSLSSTDEDTGDTHTYTLATGTGDTDNASFTILGNELQAAEAFDFETKSTYSIRLQTTDAGGLTFEDTFTVLVTNVNEAPTAIAISANSIDEYNAVGDLIGSFTTTDADAGDAHTYALVAGAGDTDNASFTINGTDLLAGEVYDFETKSSYSIRVQTTDAGGLSFEESFTITINDVNEQEAQTITFDPIADQFLEEGSITLSATASSGLAVEYAITSGPATISGDVVSFTGVGTVTVEASQSGNENYLAADPVSQMFEIVSVTAILPGLEETKLSVYPNPATEVLHLSNIQNNVQLLQVTDITGQVIEIIENPDTNETMEVDNWKDGVYFILINGPDSQQTIKFIKQ